MSERRRLYAMFTGVTLIAVGAFSALAAQSVHPVRFGDRDVDIRSGTSVSQSPGAGDSALTVVGEVLTVDSDHEPRLWGRGRPGIDVYLEEGETGTLCSSATPGGPSFGLSDVLVDWGSAADGCPAGFWVCTHADVANSNCDTQRPDSVVADGLDCSGAPLLWDGDKHWGWVANGGSESSPEMRTYQKGFYHRESGFVTTALDTCNYLPVWCCR